MQNPVLHVMHEMKHSIRTNNLHIAIVMNTVTRVLEYFEMECFNYRQLSRILENDPVLSAYLLKAANVCIFNKPENVTRLDQACMMLGTSMLKTLIISHRWRACLNLHQAAIRDALHAEWQKSLNLAVASYTLAHQLRHPKTDDVFLNVMLENISLFLFAKHCDALPEKDALIAFRVLSRYFKQQYSHIILTTFNLAHLNQQECCEGINRINLRDIKALCAIHIQTERSMQPLQECYAFRKLPSHIAITYGNNQLLSLREMRAEIDRMCDVLNFYSAPPQHLHHTH